MRRSGGKFLAAVGVFGAAVLMFAALAAPSAPQEEAFYVGSEFCAECHVDQFEKFQGNAHDNLLAYIEEQDDEPSGVGGCEACHGAGSLHVELAGTEEPGFRLAMNGSPDPDACWQCHSDVRGQFSLPERHPVEQGFMVCSDCHDPHDATNRSFLNLAGNATCTECHMEKQGPWVFPHRVQEVEGCTACHQPHGSVNAHLLPFREIRYTCLGCHTGAPTFHRLPGFEECTACHAQIHGSNTDPYFLDE